MTAIPSATLVVRTSAFIGSSFFLSIGPTKAQLTERPFSAPRPSAPSSYPPPYPPLSAPQLQKSRCMVPSFPLLPALLDGIEAEREASGAAGSGSDGGADAGSRRRRVEIRRV